MAILLVVAAVMYFGKLPDVLKGMNSNHDHSPLEVQGIVSAFCLSPIVGELLQRYNRPTLGGEGGSFTFEKDGDIENEDYVQSSIYALLYAMYKNSGNLTSEYGVKYQFTFNTWGIAPSPYPKEDPQRHGKAAYAGLVTQEPALEYAKKLSKPLEIVEIGCGTGAGANLITREVYPTANYLALDMQQAAINTCKQIHGTTDNPGLNCQLVPGGVGKTRNVPKNDETVDFVVISETHIADIEIGQIEREIFGEVKRILKPGGLFLWGNALPTRVWQEGADYLTKMGFELVSNLNHTQGAVRARDEDKERVDLAIKGLLEPYYVFNVPYFGPRCELVSERLIANFYRHPGTALYIKMVTGYDSYMHQAWRKK